MARIRSIKPEFPQSESMGRVSREARLCFIMLWTIADDEGRLRGSSRMLASLLYPYDDDAPSLINGWLDELEAEDCIVRYLINGSTYLQIVKWTDHQKIDKPSKSKIDPFAEASRKLAKPLEESATDLGSRIKEEDQGRGSRIKETPARAPKPPVVSVSILIEAGFDENTALEFIAHKASVKAPLTERAWADHKRESSKAGWTPQQAAEKVMAKGWKGFEAAWVAGKIGGKPTAANADELERHRSAVNAETTAAARALLFGSSQREGVIDA